MRRTSNHCLRYTVGVQKAQAEFIPISRRSGTPLTHHSISEEPSPICKEIAMKGRSYRCSAYDVSRRFPVGTAWAVELSGSDMLCKLSNQPQWNPWFVLSCVAFGETPGQPQ